MEATSLSIYNIRLRLCLFHLRDFNDYLEISLTAFEKVYDADCRKQSKFHDFFWETAQIPFRVGIKKSRAQGGGILLRSQKAQKQKSACLKMITYFKMQHLI